MMFIATAIASLALFLYGIDLIDSGLNKLFGAQIKKFLHLASKSVLWAIIIGGAVTILIQNSNTPVVMLMGFATSRLIDLKGAIGIILGADIGSTLTVQFISFNLYDLGIFLIAAGFLIGVFVKGQKAKAAASFFTGFGFILFSMKLFTTVSGIMSPYQIGAEKIILQNPYMSFFASLALTTIIQSSAATIALAISFANVGLINLSQALPIILGANIGTCSTAVFAMFKADEHGRRVAISHLLFKVAGVIIIVIFYKPFILLAQSTSDSVPHQIANAHTLFNILIVLVFAPLASVTSRLFEKYIKTGKELQLPDKPQYLDESALSTPSLAFDYALKEVVRLAHYVYSMLDTAYRSLVKNDLWTANELNADNNAVEKLASCTKVYLAHISTAGKLTQREAAHQFELITYIKNLEVISDIISQNLSSEIEKKTTEKHRLSEEGWKEIKDYFQEVMKFFEEIISAVETNDPALTYRFIEKKRQFAHAELLLLKHHLERLNKGYKESIETSALHMELVSILRRIVSQLTYMIEPINL